MATKAAMIRVGVSGAFVKCKAGLSADISARLLDHLAAGNEGRDDDTQAYSRASLKAIRVVNLGMGDGAVLGFIGRMMVNEGAMRVTLAWVGGIFNKAVGTGTVTVTVINRRHYRRVSIWRGRGCKVSRFFFSHSSRDTDASGYPALDALNAIVWDSSSLPMR